MRPKHKATFAVATLCYQTFIDMAPAFEAAVLDEPTSCEGVLGECVEQGINQFCAKCLNPDHVSALDDAISRLEANRGNLTRCPKTLGVYEAYLSSISARREQADKLYKEACAQLEGFKDVTEALGHECYGLQEHEARRSDNLFVESGRRDHPLCSTDPDDLDIICRFKPFAREDPHSFSFLTYQNIPFAFLHEYISHVLPAKIEYRQFSEGWLMWAAQQFVFLKGAMGGLSWHHHCKIDEFVRRCVYAPGKSFAPPNGYATAGRFWSFVLESGLDGSVFRAITCEAAVRAYDYGGAIDLHHTLMEALVALMASIEGKERLGAILKGYTTFDDFYESLVEE